MSLNGTTLKEGETLTIDGGTGEVIVGEVTLIPPDINEDFETVLGWADGLRRLKVRTNADTPRMPPRRASSAPRASASAAPSTCSWPTTGCPSCAR